MEVALTYPRRVRGLVLVDSVGLGREIVRFLRLGSILGVGEYFERPSLKRIKNLLRSTLYDPGCMEDEVVAEMYRYRKRPGAPQELLRLLRTGVNIFGQRPSILRLDRLPSLRAPLMVLWGRQDQIVPVSHAQAAVARAPNARLHIFDRCGHWPHFEHPAEFVETVDRFWGGVAS